jgi:hypothetical protein
MFCVFVGNFGNFIRKVEVFAEPVNNIAYGDINKDNIIDAFDIAIAKRLLLLQASNSDLTIPEEAEVTGDGIYNGDDLNEIRDFALGKIDYFSIQKLNTVNEIKNEINQKDFSVVNSAEPTETKITTEMSEIINKCDNNPVKVYEYFYNAVKTEFYVNSRKGAIGTYEQFSGNDVDQASLLIAVLRHMGYSANYVTGVVSITSQQAMEITGVQDIEIAANIINIQEGKNAKTVVDSNKNITSLSFEHTWVEASIPLKYIDASKNSDELTTIQLDLSFKTAHRLGITDVLLANGLSEEELNSLADSYDKQYEFNSKLNELNDDLQDFSLDNLIEPVSFEILPSVLPFTVVSQNTPFTNLTLDNSDYIEFYIDDLKINELKSSELCGSQLVIEYDFDEEAEGWCELLDEFDMPYPKTIVDLNSTYIDTYNMLIQANLKLNGKTIGLGDSVKIGTYQKLKMVVHSGVSVTTLDSDIIAGSMYAVVVNTQNISSNELMKNSKSAINSGSNISFSDYYNNEYLGALLTSIGKNYFAELDNSSSIYEESYKIYNERKLSVCVVSFSLETETNRLGAITVNKQGRFKIDAQLLHDTPISLENDANLLEAFRLNLGVRSSYLESETLENITGSKSVSTMEILDYAEANNIEIVSISKDNANYQTLLNSLQVSSSVKSDITAYVENGCEITVPIQSVTIGSWVGTGYIVTEKGENYSSYTFMLSSGIAGGETTDPFNGFGDFIDDVLFYCYIAAVVLSIISCIALSTVSPLTFVWIPQMLFSLYGLLKNTQALVRYIDDEDTTKDKIRTGAISGGNLLLLFLNWVIK